MQKIKDNWLLILITLALGVGLGFVLRLDPVTDKSLESIPFRASDPSFNLINPLLGYDSAEAINFGELVDLKNNINNLIQQETDGHSAEKISVYFRDLDRARWIGINQDEPFSPASLLKVPLMMAYYKLSETNPGVLNKQIVFDGKNNIDKEETIQPAQRLQIGQTYTVDELIKEMITYSDNNAMQLLLNNIDPAALNQVFVDLDVLLPTSGAAQDFISAKTYALFFRVLYGATYLSHYNSQKALDILNKSAFKDGLAAGVPNGLAVAHKFGEYGLKDPVTGVVSSREFHDCGIVYYLKSPYFLCVMTKGNDLGKLEQSVRDISKAVFDYVKKNNR